MGKSYMAGNGHKFGAIAAVSPLLFIVVVLYLHAVQPNYDPVHQFMSELVLGPRGTLMLVAFLSLGVSLAALGVGLFLSGAQLVIAALLLIGAMGFVGAGFIRLDVHANAHIGLVALSFMMVALSMYLLPGLSKLFQRVRERAVSWGFALGLGISVALGAGTIPSGIGQRLSASFVILWLVWAGVRLFRSGERQGPQ